MNRFFLPSVFAPETQAHFKRLAYLLVASTMLATTALTLAQWYVAPQQAGRWLAILLATNLAGLALLGLIRRGRTLLAARLFVAAHWLLITALAATGGGLNSAVASYYVLVVLLAGVLLGARAAVEAGLACAVSGVALYAAGRAGWLPPATLNLTRFALWTQSALYVAVVLGLQRLTRTAAAQALARDQAGLAERQQAASALDASEGRYRLLFDNMLDGFAYCRMLYEDGVPRDFVYLEVNPAFESLTGLRDVAGKKVSAVIPGVRATNPELLEIYGRVAATGQPEQFETYLEPLQTWFFVSAYRPQPEHFVAVFRDITARKQAEAALRLQAAALEAAANAIIITDRAGRIEWINPAFTALSGYTAAESLGRNPRELVHSGRHDEAFYKEMWGTILAGRVWRGEVVNRRKDGSLYTEEQTITPVLDEQGRVSHFVAIKQDVTERKASEAKIQSLLDESGRRLRHMQALRAIDMAIAGSVDSRLTLGVILRHVVGELGVDAASVLRLEPGSFMLRHAAERGFRNWVSEEFSLQLGENYAGRAAQEREVLVVPNIAQADPPVTQAEPLLAEGFVFFAIAPIVAKGQTYGVLEVFQRGPRQPDQEWLDFLAALAGQTAIAIDSAALFQDLQRSNADLISAYNATIEGWSRALDLRDKETEGHSQRVTEMTLRLAQRLGLGPAQLADIRRGALLHDIGKMGIPDSILLKPAELTEEEWAIMRRHPEYGYQLLSPITYLRPALDIPYCHHERWDGSGYPRGLRGEAIPLAARIFAVADVWDALRSDRPYRAEWPAARVRKHIRSLAGSHLDPQVVEAFFAMMEEE